jgi:hypothetical protein
MVRRDVAVLIATVSLAAACGSPSSPPTGASPTGPSAPVSASPASPPSASSGSVATPSPAGSPTFHVVGLRLGATPAHHIGACPVKITFTATVDATGGEGTVSYRWLSSDGDASPTKTLHFDRPGTITQESDWTVNPTSMPTHAGWSSIELIDTPSSLPDGETSARADFVFTCDTDDDIEAIGFGIGGSDADCSIAKNGRTFASTDPVRMVANWWPSVATGTVVTIRLTRDGELVDGYPVTTNLHESTHCIHGAVSQGFLAVGHYRIDLAPDTARAINGEFDVK